MDIFEPGSKNHQAGDIVYVIYRNPHTFQNANIQEGEIVHDPEYPGELALFLYETYYPLNAGFAIYHSASEAEKAYIHYFGSVD